jgi:hypothetical protein
MDAPPFCLCGSIFMRTIAMLDVAWEIQVYIRHILPIIYISS